MLPQYPLLRRALCATTALALAWPAAAQTAGNGAPPARVGQVAGLVGSVSFNGAGSNGAWVQAQGNYPLTAGDTLYTQTGAEAAVALDSSRLTLAPSTELQVTSLDEQNFAATQAQGEVFIDLAALAPGQSFTINTPGDVVTMQTGGQYDIIAGPTTTVSVLSGQAAAGQATLGTGQAADLSGGQAQVAQLQQDDFMRHVLAELSPPPPPYVPQVVNQMTGVAALSSYGSWQGDPDYGAVWYPQVGADWAPYRDGSWAFIAPWGWTWVEAEPWGFAPFHYGRWIHRDDRWGWVPAADRGEDAGYRPVYAPAVVTFFGLASGGHVGWVPLAPGEAYHPPYRASDSYIQRINRLDINRGTSIDGRETGINGYANRGGATYVPAAAMEHGERIHAAGGPPPAALANARPAEGMINSVVRPDMAQRPAEAPHAAPMRPAADEVRAGMAAPVQEHAVPGGDQRPAAMPARPTFGAPAPRPEMQRPEPARPAPQMPQAPRPEAPRPPEPRPVEVQRPIPPPAAQPREDMPRPEAPRAEAPRPEPARPTFGNNPHQPPG